MDTIITGLIGMALLIVFLGVFIFWVQAVPLIVIMIGVIGLMAYDFWQEVRSQANSPYRR